MISTKPSNLQLFNNLIRLLVTAAANIALYSSEHRQVLRMNKQALDSLAQLFIQLPNITLKVIDEQIIFDNRPVAPNPTIDKFRSALLRNGISHLQIEPGVYAEELLGLINVLSKSPDNQIAPRDSEHIHYGSVEVRYQQSANTGLAALELAEIATLEADRFMDIYDTARTRKKLEVSGIQEIVEGFVNAFNSQGEAFLAVAPLRSMDEYTYTHSTNICLLNLAQAKALGIDGQLLNDIGIAAMLHDVGKMFISPDILSKTEKLDEQEWQIMQQHPRLGAEYLIDTPGVPRLAVVTAFEHHMRYDGAGYPETSPRWEQHLCSQITAISDTYDAMRTYRAYEESLDQDQIISTMLDLAGTKLHPQLTYNFLQMLVSVDSSDG